MRTVHLAVALAAFLLAAPPSLAWGNLSFQSTTNSSSQASTQFTSSSSTDGCGVAALVMGGVAVAGAVFAMVWAATQPARLKDPPVPYTPSPPPRLPQPRRAPPETAPPPGDLPPAPGDSPPAPGDSPPAPGGDLPPPPPPPPTSALTPDELLLLRLRSYDYVRPNARQLRADLAAGAGPTIDDLAAMAGIHARHLERFGRLLHAHRAELTAHLSPRRLSPDSTAALFLAVGRLGWSDPVISEDAGRALALRSATR